VTAIISATLAVSGYFVISKSQHNHTMPADRRIDYGGVALFMIGIIAVVYYLSESTSSGFGSAKTLPAFLAGLALLGIFIFWELRVVKEYPIMPVHIWKSRRFAASVIIIVCVTATYNIMIFYTSLTFQNVLRYSPLITACCYIIHGAGLVLGLYTVTRLFAFIRTKFIMMIGWTMVIVSAVVLSRAEHSYFPWFFVAFIINCLGISPTWMSCQVNAVADAGDEDQGVVGAVFNVAIQVGGPIGLAIATILANANTPLEATGEALVPGYRAAFYTMAVIGGVGLVITAILSSNQDPPEFSGAVPSIVEVDEEKKVEGGDKEEVHADGHEYSEVGHADSTISVAPTIVEESEKSLP
jgi:Na+/melibiose symporter-like transporter